MSTPLIALTMSRKPSGKPEYPVMETYAAYGDVISQAGGFPVFCPYHDPERFAQLADGLFLTGGPDVEPSRYGEAVLNDTVTTAPERDAFEWEVIRAFLARRKPILCVCRGHQILNVFLGGTLYQDLPEQLHSRHSDVIHQVTATGGFLKEQFGPAFLVNSYHHQAVRTLGRGLAVTAYADHGIIEAYESPDGNLQSYQWHPERMSREAEGCPSMAPLFARFVETCRGR